MSNFLTFHGRHMAHSKSSRSIQLLEQIWNAVAEKCGLKCGRCLSYTMFSVPHLLLYFFFFALFLRWKGKDSLSPHGLICIPVLLLGVSSVVISPVFLNRGTSLHLNQFCAGRLSQGF